jgi:hypothetical protein
MHLPRDIAANDVAEGRSVDFPVTMENNGDGALFAKFYVAALAVNRFL